jgi:hypothetical protein
MWNDDDPRQPGLDWHQVATSWILAATIFACLAAWSGFHTLLPPQELLPAREPALEVVVLDRNGQ